MTKADKVFDGKVENWIKFANSLKLRLAIRISKVAPAKAKQMAEQAVRPQVGAGRQRAGAVRQRAGAGRQRAGAEYRPQDLRAAPGTLRLRLGRLRRHLPHP